MMEKKDLLDSSSDLQHHCRNGVMSVQYWSRRASRITGIDKELQTILETIFTESCRLEKALDRNLRTGAFDSITSIAVSEGSNMKQTHGTWGERIETFSFDAGIVTILDLKPNKRCSYHQHVSTWNQFYVISGKLGVLTDHGFTMVYPKQSFLVPPGLKHEFQTFDEQAVIQEIAYVKYDPNDIQRDNQGGARGVE